MNLFQESRYIREAPAYDVAAARRYFPVLPAIRAMVNSLPPENGKDTLTLFGARSWKGLSWKGWLAGVVGVAVLVFLLVKVLKVEGALLVPMAVYGFVLLMLSFCALCGVIRCKEDRCTWWIILCGALLFAFSDSLIAAGTFGVVTFELREFVIMLTYLIAQSLLAWGAVRLARQTA